MRTTLILRLLVPALVLAHTAASDRARAQVRTVGEIEAVTHVGAFLGQGTWSGHALTARGTRAVWSGPRIDWTGLVQRTPQDRVQVRATLSATASLATTVVLEASGDQLLGASARGRLATTASPRNTAPAAGPVSVLVRHPFRSGSRVDFSFEFVPVFRGPASTTVHAAVDAGNDSSIDWQPAARSGQRVTRRMTLVAGPNGILIRLDLLLDQVAVGPGASSAAAVLRYDFQAGQQQCAFSQYGGTCGPKLAAAFVTESFVRLSIAGGKQGSFGLWMLGSRPLQIPIPGTSCLLSQNLVAGEAHVYDSQGTARLAFAIPPGLLGDSFWQDAMVVPSAMGPDIKTSDAVRLGCVLR